MVVELIPRKFSIPWTSNPSGSATVAVPNVFGTINRIATVPGTGASQPTDQYDLTLTDEHGIDVMAAKGANQSATASGSFIGTIPGPSGFSEFPFTVRGGLTLNVTNAGVSKSGTVYVYIL